MIHLLKNISYSFHVVRRETLNEQWRTELFRPEYIVIPYARLYFPVEGEGFVSIGAQTLHIRPGYLYLLPPFCKAKVSCPGRLVKYWTHFNAHISGTLLDYFSICRVPYELPAENPELIVQAFQVLKRIQAPYSYRKQPVTPIQQLELEAAFTLLLSPFFLSIQNMEHHAKGYDPLLLDILLYIEEHLPEKLNLETLAGHFHRNPTYLSNLFTKKMGIPLIRYLNNRKIVSAVNLLNDNKLSVKEIADRLGVENPLVFARLFKRHTGRSPREYRNYIRVLE